jgi:uncharacterized protein
VNLRIKAVVFAVTVICSLSSSSAEPVSAAPSASDVRDMLQANGAGDIGTQGGPIAAQQISANLHRTIPTLSPRADAIVMDVVVSYLRRQADHDDVAERLVPIYAKYLTKDDVRRITDFYRSPTGRKLVSVTPAISLESAKIGQEWMDSILPGLQTELLNRLKSEKLIE